MKRRTIKQLFIVTQADKRAVRRSIHKGIADPNHEWNEIKNRKTN